MGLKRLPYKRLQHLIGLHLSTKEDENTKVVINRFTQARRRGYLTKLELETVCRWKSPRAIRHIRRNRTASVETVTRQALSTRSERHKLELLTSLYGVSIPMASAILMLTNPSRYGVIDIRVWQLLNRMGTVSNNSDGIGFKFSEWYRYLMVLRFYAKKYHVRARDIERTLFRVHRIYQKGNLYKR